MNCTRNCQFKLVSKHPSKSCFFALSFKSDVEAVKSLQPFFSALSQRAKGNAFLSLHFAIALKFIFSQTHFRFLKFFIYFASRVVKRRPDFVKKKSQLNGARSGLLNCIHSSSLSGSISEFPRRHKSLEKIFFESLLALTEIQFHLVCTPFLKRSYIKYQNRTVNICCLHIVTENFSVAF